METKTFYMGGQSIEVPVEMLCGRCGDIVVMRGDAPCWYCGQMLCEDCFEKADHCGHPEVESVDYMQAKLAELVRSRKQHLYEREEEYEDEIEKVNLYFDEKETLVREGIATEKEYILAAKGKNA